MVERIKNKNGFTIIEIMVVIALIGILAAVLVPRFNGVKDSARDAGMLANAKMVEAYVASVIDNYTIDSAVDDTAGTDNDLIQVIKEQFDGTDALTNPYSGVQANTNIVVDEGTGYSTGDSAETPDDDGVVYVIIDDSAEPLTVYINGFDADGNELINTQRTITR